LASLSRKEKKGGKINLDAKGGEVRVGKRKGGESYAQLLPVGLGTHFGLEPGHYKKRRAPEGTREKGDRVLYNIVREQDRGLAGGGQERARFQSLCYQLEEGG